MSEPAGNLLYNLVYFGRLLRAAGVDIQLDGISNLVKATAWISIERKQDFYLTARSLLIRSQQDLATFDRAFEKFWNAGVGRKPEIKPEADPHMSIEFDPGAPETLGTDAASIAPRIRFSPEEALRHKDFAELNPEELEQIKPLLAALQWRLGQRHTRRWQRGGGYNIDVRRMLRQSLRSGGESLHVIRRRQSSKPRRLVVIADISGSMERYSTLLLHFIFGLSQSLNGQAEAFVFSTRLTRITRQLHSRDVEHALDGIAHQVSDWSGGTRIGQALRTFNFVWIRRVLTRGPVVLLVSDGWDRGDAGLLRVEMARLQRSSNRLIWLNPLLGSPDYEPLTRGMQEALPFVDDFLPIHNLSSVEQLARRLEGLEERRPVRKQQPILMSERPSGTI